jgi:hypothetical protein
MLGLALYFIKSELKPFLLVLAAALLVGAFTWFQAVRADNARLTLENKPPRSPSKGLTTTYNGRAKP